MDNNLFKVKTYKKDYEYSYTLGAFATYELIKTKAKNCVFVCIHSSYSDKAELELLCKTNSIAFVRDDKMINRISLKDNTYVIGVFNKYNSTLDKDKPHIVLVNPMDMGNLGTIIRTIAGLNIINLAIIKPSADIFEPKTIRASMGALFRINFHLFDSFDDYLNEYSAHNLYPFMLDAKQNLNFENCPKDSLFSLIYGNEAKGLDESYAHIGTSIKIAQTDLVDSLNLSIAVGISGYIFSLKNNLLY